MGSPNMYTVVISVPSLGGRGGLPRTSCMLCDLLAWFRDWEKLLHHGYGLLQCKDAE